MVHSNTRKPYKPKQLKEKTEPFLDNYFGKQKYFSEHFATTIIREVTSNYLIKIGVDILELPPCYFNQNYTVPGYTITDIIMIRKEKMVL